MHDTIRFRPMAFGGHCYYVRRCARGKPHEGDEHDRRVDGIALPEFISEESSLWVEVLGVGPRCGRPVDKDYCIKYHRFADNHTDWPPERRRMIRWGIGTIPKVGDLVKLPAQFDKPPGDVGVIRSPLHHDEFFVEESKPELIMET